MPQRLSNFKAEFFKALAHPLRISILDALRDQRFRDRAGAGRRDGALVDTNETAGRARGADRHVAGG